MAKKTISLADDFCKAVAVTAEILLSGGVVVFPTETVYGIGVASGNDAALARLRRLKQRDANKPFQILTASIDAAEKIGAVFSPRCLSVAKKIWPGPLTMVVPDAADSGTLGIRIPDSQFILALCRELEMPIISSSANVAGCKPPQDAVAADVFDDVDLLVDGGAVTGGVPSTVIRCLGDELEVLRAGAIDADAITAVWSM